MKPPYIKKHGTMDGFTIWMVNGPYIRKHTDPDFTDMDQHLHREFIPEKEIWIDAATDPGEIDYMAKSGIREAKAMARGVSFDKAETDATDAEKRERKGDAAVHRAVKLERLGGNRKVTVWLVDGRAVRDRLDIDFTEGGHGRVYDWMPKNEIWLDNDTSPADRPFNLLHELFEWNAMGDGEKYEHAHHEALALELSARRDPKRWKAMMAHQESVAGGSLGITKKGLAG